MSDISSDEHAWTEKSEHYLQALVKEAESKANYHVDRAFVYTVFQHLVGVPLIILGSLMSIVNDQVSDTVTKILFLAVSIISSTQYYFQPARKANIHREKASSYDALVHRIKKTLVLTRSKRRSCGLVLTELHAEMEEISKNQTALTPVAE